MISRTIFTDILIIAFLIAFQIFVLNRIIIMGKFTPVLYPVFVIFYPFFRNKYHMLVASFVLGLGIDAFLYTWGINAFATTLVAYYRSVIFRTSTETSTDFSLPNAAMVTVFIFHFFGYFPTSVCRAVSGIF
jgi:rod shape-determining protein MreD